ncbi:MAG: helix-turn-helix domain-containing protein [Candidatus Doudnabacteria bacterium]|nr:helix-turn-helix domain-containing protein [Candidatus Doudnabacteria bacterium]
MWTGEIITGSGILVTTTRAAELLDLKEDTVRRMCDENELPCNRERGYRLIPKVSVMKKREQLERLRQVKATGKKPKP